MDKQLYSSYIFYKNILNGIFVIIIIVIVLLIIKQFTHENFDTNKNIGQNSQIISGSIISESEQETHPIISEIISETEGVEPVLSEVSAEGNIPLPILTQTYGEVLNEEHHSYKYKTSHGEEYMVRDGSLYKLMPIGEYLNVTSMEEERNKHNQLVKTHYKYGENIIFPSSSDPYIGRDFICYRDKAGDNNYIRSRGGCMACQVDDKIVSNGSNTNIISTCVYSLSENPNPGSSIWTHKKCKTSCDALNKKSNGEESNVKKANYQESSNDEEKKSLKSDKEPIEKNKNSKK
jgi:hypothetical protein